MPSSIRLGAVAWCPAALAGAPRSVIRDRRLADTELGQDSPDPGYVRRSVERRCGDDRKTAVALSEAQKAAACEARSWVLVEIVDAGI